MANTITQWSWSSKHVQDDIRNGEFVSSESTLILSGPSRLDMVADSTVGLPNDQFPNGSEPSTLLYPLGLVQSAQIGQNRNIARFFEIGAKRSYFIPGRIATEWGMNRVLFFGPSLLRLPYATAPEAAVNAAGGSPLQITDNQGNPNGQYGTSPDSAYGQLFDFYGISENGVADEFLDAGAPSDFTFNKADGQEVNGNRDFWINLNSPIFNVPFGMAFFFKDSKNRPYGAFYMEENLISSYTITLTSQDVVIAENIAGVTDLIRPIKLLQSTAA